MRKTKIVCTIGPASESVDLLCKLIESGMDVARLNFSHGTHQEHAQRIENIRGAVQKTAREVAILLDTKGPEIRLGKMEGGKRIIQQGEKIILTSEQIMGTHERVSVSYCNLPNEVQAGQLIMINDGLVTLEVEKVEGDEIFCVARNTGEIGDRKGVNLPNVNVNLPALSDKDREDIIFAIKHNIDFIAASFVRKADDVIEIRKILEQYNSDINIIAKIENREGVNNLDDILKVADGVMVARGDLGVQIATEEVPIVQKRIIRKCNAVGKPVITATQMLDSMIRNPRPTRAEASDVANAILDGTDAIMLSGETASGKYPLLSVKMMEKIALHTEEALKYGPRADLANKEITITEAISHASFAMAKDLKATAIITPTTSGSTARLVSKFRPRQTIIGATQSKQVIRKLALVWGVYGIEVKSSNNTDDMISEAVEKALNKDLIAAGDLVVITAGVPADVPGTTNLIKVHVAADTVIKATGIGKHVVSGRTIVIKNLLEDTKLIQEGDIVVVGSLERELVPMLSKATALVTEEGGLTSAGAIVAINLGIPALVGAADATGILQSGEIITVDAQRGLVYKGKVKAL